MAVDRSAFDLFSFLGQLSKRDPQAFEKLSPEGQKAAHPYVIMRWMAGTADRAQIVRLNTFANRYMFSLGDSKSLLFKLLAASATGNVGRYSWIKGPGQVSTRLANQAVQDRYKVSSREAAEYLEMLDPSDIIECAEDAGWPKEQLKKLTTELGKDDAEPRRSSKVGRKSKN